MHRYLIRWNFMQQTANILIQGQGGFSSGVRFNIVDFYRYISNTYLRLIALQYNCRDGASVDVFQLTCLYGETRTQDFHLEKCVTFLLKIHPPLLKESFVHSVKKGLFIYIEGALLKKLAILQHIDFLRRCIDALQSCFRNNNTSHQFL